MCTHINVNMHVYAYFDITYIFLSSPGGFLVIFPQLNIGIIFMYTYMYKYIYRYIETSSANHSLGFFSMFHVEIVITYTNTYTLPEVSSVSHKPTY
jgi:hypothetical protein